MSPISNRVLGLSCRRDIFRVSVFRFSEFEDGSPTTMSVVALMSPALNQIADARAKALPGKAAALVHQVSGIGPLMNLPAQRACLLWRRARDWGGRVVAISS